MENQEIQIACNTRSEPARRDDIDVICLEKQGVFLLMRATILRDETFFRSSSRPTLLCVMATLLPPPKRQKVYHGVPEPEPEPIQPSPNIIVQFVNELDGAPIAPAVNLPANVARDSLQLLVNQLRTKASHQDTSVHLDRYIYHTGR